MKSLHLASEIDLITLSPEIIKQLNQLSSISNSQSLGGSPASFSTQSNTIRTI